MPSSTVGVRDRSAQPLGGNLNASVLSTHRQGTPVPALAALCFMGAYFAISVAHAFVIGPKGRWFRVIFIAALCSLWFYGLWRRHAWLWWITVIIGVGACFAPVYAALPQEPVRMFLYWLQYSLLAPATVALLMPAARNWFRRRAAA